MAESTLPTIALCKSELHEPTPRLPLRPNLPEQTLSSPVALEGGTEREIEQERRSSRERWKKESGGGEKSSRSSQDSGGLPLGLSFHVCVRLNLLILSWPLFPGGVSGDVSTVTRKGPPSLPLSLSLSTHHPSLPKRRPSPKSPLYHVSRSWEAPGIPLRSFPWSLGSSLCHVAQSEPSLSRITQLSMGGQMTIIRLHSSGPYLKRQKKEPWGLKMTERWGKERVWSKKIEKEAEKGGREAGKWQGTCHHFGFCFFLVFIPALTLILAHDQDWYLIVRHQPRL